MSYSIPLRSIKYSDFGSFLCILRLIENDAITGFGAVFIRGIYQILSLFWILIENDHEKECVFMLKNIKTERNLTNVFYIVEVSRKTNKDWWQLRLKDSHFCMSAVHSKEKVLECLYEICMRYKTHKNLMRALKNCENHVSKEYVVKCQKEYNSSGKHFDEDVEEVVLRAIEDLKNGEGSKKKKPLKVINTIGETPKVTSPEISLDTTTGVKKKLPKKKIGLINI